MTRIIVDIYEPEGGMEMPVVTHVFYGKTLKEAEAVEQAHTETDSFYRAAVEGRKFRGIELSVEARVVTSKGE